MPAVASAEPTLELYVQGAEEVFQGDPESSSVDAQGRISVGPVLVDLAKGSDRPIVSMAAGPKGSLYAGTAGGGLLRISAGGRAKVLAPFEGKVVSALASSKGQLFAATGPDGEIATVSGAGRVQPYFQPAAKYVWAILPEAGGLVVATGAPGRIVRVSAGGRSEVMFDPGETHVRALVRHPKRGLIAGGGQKGIVYQLEGKGAYALYDSDLEEVTAFAIDDRTGDLYAALVSASVKGVLEPSTWIGPVKGDEDDEDANPIKSSEVVRIRPSGHVEKVWTSKGEGAMALDFDAKSRQLRIATGTGPKGRARIYALDVEDRDRVRLYARLAPSLATAMIAVPTGGALAVGTAPAGHVIRVGPAVRKTSVYLSVEQDLERISDIGRLWFDADVPRGAQVGLHLRTGNTKVPDDTWSQWTEAVTDPEGGEVKVRKGRYAQFKVELSAGAGGAAPVLKSMHASVVRMNVPPEIKEVFLLRRGVYMTALPPEGEKERTITLSSTTLRDLRKRVAPDKDRTRVRQGELPGSMTVAWTAEDENADGLLFRIELARLDGPGAKDGFRTVADDQEHDFFSFDSGAYPDGRYRFRITASDRPSNPPSAALLDQFESEPFTIDNTPPSVTKLTARFENGRLQIRADAEDAASTLQTAELSVDGGPWLMLPAQDGLLDAKAESLAMTVVDRDVPGQVKLAKGAHTVRVRVFDEAGNSATASARFER